MAGIYGYGLEGRKGLETRELVKIHGVMALRSHDVRGGIYSELHASF